MCFPLCISYLGSIWKYMDAVYSWCCADPHGLLKITLQTLQLQLQAASSHCTKQGRVACPWVEKRRLLSLALSLVCRGWPNAGECSNSVLGTKNLEEMGLLCFAELFWTRCWHCSSGILKISLMSAMPGLADFCTAANWRSQSARISQRSLGDRIGCTPQGSGRQRKPAFCCKPPASLKLGKKNITQVSAGWIR